MKKKFIEMLKYPKKSIEIPKTLKNPLQILKNLYKFSKSLQKKSKKSSKIYTLFFFICNNQLVNTFPSSSKPKIH